MDSGTLQTVIVCSSVLLAGFVDSVAGGGGLISLPAYFAAGLPPHAALATNKFSSCCGTLTSVIRFWHAGVVNIRAGILAAAGALAGSVAGARIALLLPAQAINTVMLVLVPAVLVFMLAKDRLFSEAGEGRRRVSGFRVGAVSLALGLGIGAYDGFFGPGAGTFLAIGFTALLGFRMLNAAASARLANLASNAGALAVFLLDGRVRFPLALYAAVAAVVGHQLGSMLALRKGARVIKPVMVAVLFMLMAEVIRRRWF